MTESTMPRPAWRRRLPLLTALVGTLLAALVLAACGGDSDDGETTAAENGSAATTDITIGTIPSAGSAMLMVAADQGIFEENGLNATLDNVAATPNVIANIQSGTNQFGYTNGGSIMAAAQEGLPVKIVSSALFSNPEEQGIFVPTDSDIQEIEDLAGKRIAISALETVQHGGIVGMLQDAGVDPDSVRFVVVPVQDFGAALRSGTADAAALNEPFVTQEGDSVRRIGGDLYEAYSTDDGTAVIAYFITSEEYANESPEVIESFRTAIDEAKALSEEDPQVVRDAIGAHTEVPADVVAEMELPAFRTELAEESLQKQADLLTELGWLSEAPDVQSLFVP